MVKTFDDLYQGLAVDNVLQPAKTSHVITPTPSNNNAINPERCPITDDQIDKFQNLFSKPFHHGFCRVVNVDHTGDHIISYVAPDKVTRLQSPEATEQFLGKKPALDISTSDFCWAGLVLTWWERKMTKAQEGMIMTMTAENWLELELVRGISDQGLQMRILQERNPTLQEMVSGLPRNGNRLRTQ